jgi:putative phosphoesterase
MPEIHRIGVISDTHLPRRARRIPDAALRHFEGVELIIHAGDLSTHTALDQLEAYAPVEAVQGNIEDAEIVALLPIKRESLIGGCVVGIVHILGDRAHYATTARVVIFGHSHIPFLEDNDGLLLLNPGSATDRRRQPYCSVALLTIEDSKPTAEIIALPL